jgi:hypothetical protein
LRLCSVSGLRHAFLSVSAIHPTGTLGSSSCGIGNAAVIGPSASKRYSQGIATACIHSPTPATTGDRRITLRRRVKAKIQWLLYCMAHNIEELAMRAAYAV